MSIVNKVSSFVRKGSGLKQLFFSHFLPLFKFLPLFAKEAD
ncbi:hypothetical protein LEP1GSC166_3287 [Leptospira kirschneri]|nr:hypothetical protein LEP1GSC166_3287 [Leptospira kirschneri]